MGSRLRPQFDHAFVHAFTRGNNRGSVFFDEFDYVGWLRLLDRTVTSVRLARVTRTA